jgi:hypothetical protein
MPALDDLRRMNLGFESYMLEMVVLALKDREEAKVARPTPARETVAV